MSSWQIPPNIASQADQKPTNATSGIENMETTCYESNSPDHKLIPPYLTPSSSCGGFPTETGQYGAHLPSPSTYGTLPYHMMPYSTPAPSSTFTTPPNTAGHPPSWPTESPNPNFVSNYDGRGFSTAEAATYPAPGMVRNNFDNMGSAMGISSPENPFGIYGMPEQFDAYRSNPTAIQAYPSNPTYPFFTPPDLPDPFQAGESNFQYQAVPPQQEDLMTTSMPLQLNSTQRGYPIFTQADLTASFQALLPSHHAVPLRQEDRTSATPSLLPTPSSHSTLAPKRRRGEEGQEEAASGPAPKRGRRTPPGPEFLNDEEQLLMNLKEGEEKLAWKDIAARYSSSTGKEYTDAALQMKQRRVKERLQGWKDADSRALRLAIDDYLAKNNNEMPRGNRQWTIVIQLMHEYGSTYMWSAELCQKKLKRMDRLQEVSSQQQPATSAQPTQMPQQAMSTPSVSQYSSPESGAYFYYMPQ